MDEALVAQRAALHEAEAKVLAERLETALAAEDWFGAAQAVAAGYSWAPDRFSAPVETLLDRLPPATGAELARIVGQDRRAEERAATARAHALAERYAAKVTPDALQGVTQPLGQAVIDAVRETYVDPVDEGVWFTAARARLDAIAGHYGVTVKPIRWSGIGPYSTLWQAGIDAGIPESVVVGETTNAALSALDAWSRPVWPAEITAWTQGHDGIQVGVGVQIFDHDGAVVVGYPVLGSAAWDAGVRQDDVIVAVGGVRTSAMAKPTIDAVVEALHGPPDTPVAVTFAREGVERTETLTRRSVQAETVVGFDRGPDNRWRTWIDARRGIAYVRILALRPHTDEAFDALLEGVKPKAMVIDLRGNGGGDLNATINLADRFLADGVVAELTGRTATDPVPQDGEVAWNAAVPGHSFEGLAKGRKPRLAVVIDEGTASAAELLAGVLKARANAVVVGAKSFGKVATQVLGSHDTLPVAWQITKAQLTVPGQAPLTEGLMPDHVVTLSPAEGVLVDTLLAKREHLRAHADGTPIRYTGPESDGTLPPLDRDPQLAMALSALR
ncbi:MAG: S41 family peptidase [Myxococcota bacterium]